MKKRMCTHIALCGLLSCSFVTFGMHNQTHPQSGATTTTTTTNTTATTTAEAQPTLLQKIKGEVKKIEGDVIGVLEDIDTNMHTLNQELLADLKGNPQVIVAALQDVGVKPQTAQNITTTVEKGVGIVTNVENDAHDLIQKLQAAQISSTQASTTTATSSVSQATTTTATTGITTATTNK